MGGSLVAPASPAGGPDGLDTNFLKNFKRSLQKYFSAKQFFIYVGGGKIARHYQKALLEFNADNKERDQIGIAASRLNAEVVKQAFIRDAFQNIIIDPSKKISTQKNVLVAAGWKPGWSTDYCSVVMAKNSGVKKIINLTNIDYVYDKDPNRYKNAKAMKEISWKDFRKIVGSKWSPGLSLPFDPRASRLAEILKIKVFIVNGKRMDRLEKLLAGKEFIGTTII